MKTVTWTERWVEYGGCGDPSCCSQPEYVWVNNEGEQEYHQEDCIRSTAYDHGLKATSCLPLSLCESHLKEHGVELVFVYS
jgi:hypothetical protein